MSLDRLAICALFACAGVLPAQLNGVYTVDNSLPTAGTNYNTLLAASTAVNTLGVSGPVTFFVMNTGAPYGGMHLTAFAGMGPANPVAFVGVGMPQVRGTAAAAGAGANINQSIRLGINTTINTGPTDVTIEGLDVATLVTGPLSHGAAILASGGTRVTVRGCVCHTSSVGIYGIATTNMTIEDNEVFGCEGGPGNSIVTGTGNISNQYGCAIGIETNSGGAIIRRNRVHDCLQRGIFFGANSDASASANCVVVNNMVWNVSGLLGTSTLYGGGIVARRAPGSIMSFNTVLMNTTTVTAPAMHVQGAFTLAEVSNNLLKQSGVGGVVFRFELTTTLAPTVFDYNAYDLGAGANVGAVAATLYPTLAAWQAVASPSLAGRELNTLIGPAGFVSETFPIDLHVLPATVGFQNGQTVAGVTDDVDQQPRLPTPTRGADEPATAGIFANFVGVPIVGGAPLLVSFTDTTFSTAPGGATAWTWDFEDDGILDSFVQHPTHNYVVPGTYTVSMTAFDPVNGSDLKVRTNYVVVGPYVLTAVTSGGGVGDLTVTPVPHIGALAATQGFMFLSFTTAAPVGSGPFFGLWPDVVTFDVLYSAPTPGGPIRWNYVPGLFPDVPFAVPAGSLVIFAGLSLDFVQIDLTAAYEIVNISNVARAAF